MINLVSASIALIAVLVLFIIICVVVYKTGYTTVTFTAGEKVVLYLTPSQLNAGKNIRNFRFKNSTFTLVDPNGKITTIDVTARLNAISKQFDAAFIAGIVSSNATSGQKFPLSNPNYSNFMLPRPLNIFSFPIQGYTDSATLKANNISPSSFCTNTKTCSGDVDCQSFVGSGNMCIKEAYSDPSTVQNGVSICGESNYQQFMSQFPTSTVKDHTFPVIPQVSSTDPLYTAATPQNAVVCAPTSSGVYKWQLVSQISGKCAVCETQYKVYLVVNYKVI